MQRQIHINQYNTDKQNLDKYIGDVNKKTPDTSDYNYREYRNQ